MRDLVTDEAGLDGADPSRRTVRTGGVFRLIWPLGVVVAVVLANLPALVGIVNVNPLVPVGALGPVGRKGYLPGNPFLDQYAGWTSQALGHLAAMDWVHGTVPWWNPFEGLGVPLAAEMQSAAFFPPPLLLALPQGQLYFHMTLEVTAGLATWFLARELGFGRPVATLGGILFALNGTFAWLTAAPENPVAFLPLMILGVERLYRRDNFDSVGFSMLALGLALAIYAGFPETTYFEVLFVLGWFVFRLAGKPSRGRRQFLASSGLGAGVGLLLAAPLAVAFVGYLPIAYLGPNHAGYANVHLPRAGLATFGLPYLLGPIKAFEPSLVMKTTWVDVGGFVTAPMLAVAFVGLFGGRRDRGLRWLLAGTVLVLVLWSVGVPFVQTVLEHVLPGVRDVQFFRYSSPVWELATVLLVCFGAETVVSREGRQRTVVIACGGLFALCVVVAEYLLLRPTLASLDRLPGFHVYHVVMVIWAVGIVLAITAAGVAAGWGVAGDRTVVPRRDLRRAAVGLVLALLVTDTAVMFVVPELSAPRSVTLDTGPTDYLAAHLGDGRFFSIEVLAPNYGSYFGLASIDVNDVPVPTLWSAYVPAHLAPGTEPGFIFGRPYGDGRYGVQATVKHLREQLTAYEAIDVRYVVVPWNWYIFGRGPVYTYGVARVYHDSTMAIYALPHPRPFFSTVGAPCRTVPSGTQRVVVHCSGPATLVRAELAIRGWSATVNGHSVAIVRVDGGLDSVRVPAGTSDVSFTYLPPHEDLGIGALVLGLLCVIGIPMFARPRQRRRRATDREPSPDPGALGA